MSFDIFDVNEPNQNPTADQLLIRVNTLAQKVRGELYRITQQREWIDSNYWKYFLQGRAEIFDAIYADATEAYKDWAHPVVALWAEGQFVDRASRHWVGPLDGWILKGSWLGRRDFISWLRSTYWKHNKKRLTSSESGKEAVGVLPSGSGAGLPA